MKRMEIQKFHEFHAVIEEVSNYPFGKKTRISSHPFLYFAAIFPPICSTRVLVMDKPNPVEFPVVSAV